MWLLFLLLGHDGGTPATLTEHNLPPFSPSPSLSYFVGGVLSIQPTFFFNGLKNFVTVDIFMMSVNKKDLLFRRPCACVFVTLHRGAAGGSWATWGRFEAAARPLEDAVVSLLQKVSNKFSSQSFSRLMNYKLFFSSLFISVIVVFWHQFVN